MNKIQLHTLFPMFNIHASSNLKIQTCTDTLVVGLILRLLKDEGTFKGTRKRSSHGGFHW